MLVPVHNEEDRVRRCIRSLLTQEFPKQAFEIIVVDDCSTDSTPEVLTDFGDSIRIRRHQSNRGLPAALNTALRAVRSPLVVRVDADDYVNEHFLLFLHEFLIQNDEYDAVCCDYWLVSDREQRLHRCSATTDPIGCGILFKTDDVLNVGMYDEDLRMHEDSDFRGRFSAQYRIGHLPVPLYRYRRHSSNMTNNYEQSAYYAALLRAKQNDRTIEAREV